MCIELNKFKDLSPNTWCELLRQAAQSSLPVPHPPLPAPHECLVGALLGQRALVLLCQ